MTMTGTAVPAVLVALGTGTGVPPTILIASTAAYRALGAALGVGPLRIARRRPRQGALEAL